MVEAQETEPTSQESAAAMHPVRPEPTPYAIVEGDLLSVGTESLIVQTVDEHITIALSETAHVVAGRHLRPLSFLAVGDRVRCITREIDDALVAGPVFAFPPLERSNQLLSSTDEMMELSGMSDGSSETPSVYYTPPPVNVSDDVPWSTDPAMAADGLGNVHLVWNADYYGSEFLYRTWNVNDTWSAVETLPFEGVNPALAVTDSGTVHLAFNEWIDEHWAVAHSVRQADGWSTPVYVSSNPVLPPDVLEISGESTWAPAIAVDAGDDHHPGAGDGHAHHHLHLSSKSRTSDR
jgi:hypothetical protein